MICPRCRSDQIVVETEGVEVDWCPECSGVWFDAGELEALLGRERPVDDVFGLPPDAVKEERLRCPRCRQHLRKVSLGATILDVCPHNHGIWFDADELEALAAALSTEQTRAVLELLLKTFGTKGEKS